MSSQYFFRCKFAAKMILATALLFQINSCGSSDTVNSGDVNESKIHRTYSVFYTDTDQLTKIVAGFRVGGSTGTTISLVSPSKVTVEDAELNLTGVEPQQSNAWGTSYGWQLSGLPMSSSYKFTWTKPSGATTVDVAHVVVPYRMNLSASKFSISQGIQIRLDRAITAPTAFVQATLKSATQPNEPARETSVASSGNMIYFEPRQLSRLPAGAYEIQLQTLNKTNINASAEDLGGQIVASYMSQSESVTILP